MRLFRRNVRTQQLPLPFAARAERLDRLFKRAIAATTLLALLGVVGGSPTLRFHLTSFARRLKWSAQRPIGLTATRDDIEADWRSKREFEMGRTKGVFRRAYDGLDPAFQQIIRAAGMAPDDAVIRWGN